MVKDLSAKKEKRKTTPSFVVELPLKTNRQDEKRLNDRLLCASRLANVMLQEGLKIVDAMRADPDWDMARKIKDPAVKRNSFNEVKKRHGFSSANFDTLVASHARAAGFYGRIGSHEMQSVAKRVFNSLDQWVYGKRGKPRSKGRKRPLHSVEGKNNTGMLQWKAEERVFQIERNWQIEPIIKDLKKDEWLWSALQAQTKYCRIVWRIIDGKRRWFVQLVKSGQAPIKASILSRLAPKESVGGLDLGPSVVAWCTDKDAGLVPLAPEIDRPEKEIRRIQRGIDRQRRSMNPGNYNQNKTIKRGRSSWKVSKRQKKRERQLATMHRKEAAIRRNSHGKLINNLLSKALNWKDDGVSLKALQRMYGKSVGKCAPGMLMSELKRKAERAGGSREIINVRKLKTSQYDHTVNDFFKKPLSQRWHVFADGRGKIQRDIYSAILHMNIENKEDKESTHNPAKIEKSLQALASTLSAAGLCEFDQDVRVGTAPGWALTPTIWLCESSEYLARNSSMSRSE